MSKVEPGSGVRIPDHMAQHGPPSSLPRAHRPRAPIMSTPAPLTAHLAPLWPPSPVTLVAPRPECDRTTNEYVETPFRPGAGGSPFPPASAQPLPPPPPTRPNRLPVPLLLNTSTTPQQHQQQQQHLQQHVLPPVTKQPATASFSKGGLHEHHLHHHHHHHELDSGGGGRNIGTLSSTVLPSLDTSASIMCPECGRCRCDSCQQPRPLPHRWVCNNHCLCSADAIIDYTSCLCCVKGIFYHCYESDNDESCADDPCSCGPDKRAGRWTCMAALSCVLPCLWLYWPLQCGKRAVEACYARHSRQGCRCRPPPLCSSTNTTANTAITTPEKRLLDATPDF